MNRTRPERDASAVRAEQRALWADTAEDWGGFDPATTPLTRTLIRCAGVQPGNRVLDLACGTGSPALDIARAAGLRGYVLGLDLVPELIAIACREAARQGITNIEFRAIESEVELSVANDSFDVATCKHGFMWMPEPVAAARSLRDALVEGGCVAASTWLDEDQNPLLSIAPRAARRHLTLGSEWPARPPSPLQSADALSGLLRDGGFEDVICESVFLTWEVARSAEAYVDDVLNDDPALAVAFYEAREEKQEALRAEMLQAVTALSAGGPVILTLETVVAHGVKR